MTEPTNLLLPDDEHYYFGVKLPYSPEEVRERLLRKPEYLYSLTSVDEEEGEVYRTWLYLWRCNEGWEMREGMTSQGCIAEMHARHNIRLHVVLHALTEGEALNPSTCSGRAPYQYLLVEPSFAKGSLTIPQLNLLRATGNTEGIRFHVIKSVDFSEAYKGVNIESYVPEEVPQEVINRHCLMYARRELTVLKSIHDADSMELLLPLAYEYGCMHTHLYLRCCFSDEVKEELGNMASAGELQAALVRQPWYAGSHHQRVTHPSGLVIFATYPPHGEYRRELFDFKPGRKLCYKESEGRVQILPATENDTPLPQREGGRIHILPDDCICGQYRDEHDHPIRWL